MISQLILLDFLTAYASFSYLIDLFTTSEPLHLSISVSQAHRISRVRLISRLYNCDMICQEIDPLRYAFTGPIMSPGFFT